MGRMSGGRSPRQKGDRFERELVDLFRAHGLLAQRVPLSGATAYAKGDVEVTPSFADAPWVGECKRRKVLPQWILDALGEHQFLAIRADRAESLIVIRASAFAELLQ
jgi:Holliday junction resolvase